MQRRVSTFEQERHRLQSLLQVGEFRLDLPGGSLHWTAEALHLFGLEGDEPPATLPQLLNRLHPSNRSRAEAGYERALASDAPPSWDSWTVLHQDGSVGWIDVCWEATRDAQGHCVAVRGIARDASRERRLEEQLAQAGQQDVLTGLPTRLSMRRQLSEMLEQARRSGQRLAVLYLDLNGFRGINDRWGHRAGDRLLQEVTERLRSTMMPGDFLARLGGDEFVLIQSALPADAARASDTAQRRAADLLRLLSRPYDLSQERQGQLTASIGLAVFPTDAATGEALLQCADTALHRAKSAGGDQWLNYTFEMDRKALHSRALDQDLKQSIERNEFTLAWQPQAALKASGETVIVGFEALLRWRHPEQGLISPDVFIPVAESSGDIVAIGEWVLNAACQEAMRWSRPLRVGVNVSPTQVQRGDIVASVRSALLASRLPPHRLELEVTEGMVIRDVGRAKAALTSLRELGVAITLDDFGTGYSSLTTLRAFPFDRMKLDRGFVATMTEDKVSAAIVGGTLDLARRLGLPVTAEGVETEEQREQLRLQGCDEIQGWLIGRPMPIDHWSDLTGR